MPNLIVNRNLLLALITDLRGLWPTLEGLEKAATILEFMTDEHEHYLPVHKGERDIIAIAVQPGEACEEYIVLGVGPLPDDPCRECGGSGEEQG